MATKNEIILTAEPRGTFLEGVVDGTPKPGNFGQIKAATEPVMGRHTWSLAAPGTDGKKIVKAIFLHDDLQGKLTSDAYVAGTRCKLYVPIGGEEVNIRVGEVAGTGNTFAIGDRLIINATAGYAIPEGGSPQDLIGVVMETVTQHAGNELVHVMMAA